MPPSARADHRKGLLITAIGGLVLTIDIPVLRLGDGDVWSVLLIRSGGMALMALVAWASYRLVTGRRLVMMPGRASWAVALLYGVSAITFITAVFNTSTANVVFILAFNTMFAAILSWLFLGERPAPATFAAMAAMIVGVTIIVWDGIGLGNTFGDLAALCSSLIMSGAITISRAVKRDMGFAPLVANVLPALVALAIVSQSGFSIDHPGWIVFNGLVIMPVAFWCLATGPKYISAPEVAMFFLLETVMAPIWVWIIFLEAPTSATLIGGLIMITALVAHSIWQLGGGWRPIRAKVPRRPM
ncbi:DMT family transporter [Pararhizobium haloflavum]|uniref:DMT family transporter n=1 Tax=Pararhizobium haloflavum TaxID=2037914 RepID=UPI000C17E5E5|nr:DMT family transporter [Pararhizobium haloflavum]